MKANPQTIVLIVTCMVLLSIVILVERRKRIKAAEYRKLKVEYFKQEEKELNEYFGTAILDIGEYDYRVVVKSRVAMEKYDYIRFFKDNNVSVEHVATIVTQKNSIGKKMQDFLSNNKLKDIAQYDRFYAQLESKLVESINRCDGYRVRIAYFSSAGNNLGNKTLTIGYREIERLKSDPSLLMSKAEYSKLLKTKEKELIENKQRQMYDHVNAIIDVANGSKDEFVIKESEEKLDAIIASLFDRTVNSIKKIKIVESEEWKTIENYIQKTESDVYDIIVANKMILDYYDSVEFLSIKNTVRDLMSSQTDFNNYIEEKVQSISKLFGCRVTRNDTETEDKYNYIRKYRKTVTPFTAEVSSAVFASAENSPLEYIVKYFYANKDSYPEQISKLYQLIEELETLRDAKKIIDDYKTDYLTYLKNVPQYVLQNDEAGFYRRLGFAHIDESVLNVEYKFSYTSNGGMAQRSFTVPMSEENIEVLIRLLESKLTASEFSKEQRRMMTRKLRESIKKRDNYTCCLCGNSIYKEPHLLLEIDHIVPVSAGGRTEESNLQALCWKCNRSKGAKFFNS